MPAKSNYKLKNMDVLNPFFKNFGKKMIAVIISILLWIVANLEFDIEKSFYVPVKYTNLSENLIVTNNPPQEVSFKVKGPRSELSTLTSSNSLITIDLASFKKGVSNIQVQTDIMNLPREIDVISVSPSEISLDIDKLITKNVKIHPILDSPDKGYVIEEEPKMSPTNVEIRGPEKYIKNYTAIDTSPISLKGEKSNFSIEVPIQLPSSLISIEGSNLVKVTVDLKEENLEKEFNNLNIAFKNFNGLDYKTLDKTKAVLIFDGPYSLINELNSNDIEVYVDAKDLNNDESGNHKLRVKVDYPNPNDLNLNKLSPQTIEIKLN